MIPKINKKTIRKIFLLFTVLFSLVGRGQQFQWARQIGDQGTEEANAIEVDNQGNSYIIGVAQSYRFDINPTTSGSQIIDNSSSPYSPIRDIYLIKQNENGDFLWGKTFGGIKYDQYAYEIKIGSDNNIYLFLKTTNSTTNSQFDIFISIIKVDPNGNELSRIRIKDSGFFVDSFDIDNQNNFIISGWFTNSIKIDFINISVNFQSNRLASFICKLDNFGNFIWQKTFEYPQLATNEIHVKPNGNIVAIQKGSDNGYPLSHILNIDTQNGDVIWEKKLTNQGVSTFYLDRLQNIVIAGTNGNYQGTIDVDPSQNTVSVSSQNYLLWLDSNGDFLDVKEYYLRPYKDELRMLKIESDTQNNIYVVGDYSGKIDSDPSSNQFFIEDPRGINQYGDGFLIKFDSNRNFDTAFSLYSEYRLLVKDLKIQNNNMYLVGDFNGYCDLDPTIDIAPFSSLNGGIVWSADGFIVKLGPCNSDKVTGDKDQYFCSSQNSTINNLLPNSSSVKWYDSLTSTNQLASSKPLINGQKYYATRQVGTCPESIDRLEVTVSVAQTPLMPIVSNLNFCKSENAKLSNIAISGPNIKWYDSSIGGSILPNTTILIDNTTYFASQTQNGCESSRSPITVNVNNILNPTTTSPQTFCDQQNATFIDISVTGQNIKWYDALTNGTQLSNTTPLENGITYYATQTINGCESKRTPIVIKIQNTINATGNANQTFCSSQNPTLDTVEISGNEIRWYNSAAVPLSSSTLLQDGVTYYASQTENSCESPNKLAITISLINTLPANNYDELLCDDLNNGYEKVNLSDYNSKLISNTLGYTFSYYLTFLGAEKQLAGNQITNYSNYNLALGDNKIYVRINSNNPCYAIVELKLTLISKPIITIPDVVPICENNSVTVDAGSGFDTYLWSTGATTPAIIVANPGNYSVTVATKYTTISCSSTKDFEVKKSNIATITSVETKDWTDNQNIITVFAAGAGDFEYSIDGIHFQDSYQFPALYSGAYTVHVRDKNGCGTATDEVFLLMYPKYFTPNGDGFNDTWNIKFSESEANLTIKIFDRYGKLIKELIQNNDWNGIMNGYELPSDDYWFVVNRADGKEYKGHFSLKR